MAHGHSCPTACEILPDQICVFWPSPGDLLDPGIESWFPALQVDSLPSEPPGKLGVTICEQIMKGQVEMMHRTFSSLAINQYIFI